jgi:hypothetical protein
VIHGSLQPPRKVSSTSSFVGFTGYRKWQVTRCACWYCSRHQQIVISSLKPFSSPSGTDVTAISLWDTKASSDTYDTNTYPEVLKTMARFIEGTPKAQTSDCCQLDLPQDPRSRHCLKC